MAYNPNDHHRKSIRLHGYDYAQAGAYFITVCTHNRLHLFGQISNDEMLLNAAGMTVQQCWQAIPEHFPVVELGEFVIMPNHIHGIIHITQNVGANVRAKKFLPLHDENIGNVGANNHSPLQNNYLPPQDNYSSPPHGTSKTIGSIVRGFKIGVTKWFRQFTDIQMVWQRNYYEHIIRNEESYLKIAEYINTNPLRWQKDRYYENNTNQELDTGY